MDKFIDDIRQFSVRYSEYICQRIIRDGSFVDDYQCTSEEAVNYVIDHLRADIIDGPYLLRHNYDNIVHLQSSTIARIIISGRAYNHHLLAFIKNPYEVLIGQCIRGALAFNFKWTTLNNLYDDLRMTVDNDSLIHISGIGIPMTECQININYYSLTGVVELELPRFSHTEMDIINRLRDEYLESGIDNRLPYVICGQLITEVENAIHNRVEHMMARR